VLLDHRVNFLKAFLFFLAQMFELVRLLFKGFVDSEGHLSLLEHFLELSDYLSLLSDAFLHCVHFLDFLLLYQQLLSILY
jgi:hypothetical protein